MEFRRALLAHLAGDVAAAEGGYRSALTSPAVAPAVRHHLIRLLEAQSRWAEALEERQAACHADPEDAESRVGLAMAYLALGRFAEGWPLFEARKALANVARFLPQVDYPEWDGGPVRSLTVWDEQGAGDTVQFARFLPKLAERGIDVTFVSRAELAELVAELGVRVIAANAQGAIPPADAWVMLDSLPGRMDVSLEDLAGPPSYLRAPEPRREAWARWIAPGVHIGVATHGNPRHPNDAQRSLPGEAAAFLLSLPAAVSLSPGAGPLTFRDFGDTAAAIERMSLVIAVDTAVAHLAGALGKPCWLLLPHLGVDWRWMHERSDSPWYPSITLYRQPALGDWASVLQAVARDLPTFFAKS